MSIDAKFEDGREAPLNIGAIDPGDLDVLSALAQDAVFPAHEMAWAPGQRRFALLLNRFRWEDADTARTQGRKPERVQSVLSIENVLGVASLGFDRRDPDLILSLLSVAFEPAEDAAGTVLLTLAGDGALRCRVEALELRLRDVTRPYAAPSGRVPNHPGG